MSLLVLLLLHQESAKVELPRSEIDALTALGAGISLIASLGINQRLD